MPLEAVFMERWPMSDQQVKLLIVDNDASIRELLESLFSEPGYCVRSVKDGISALSEIRHEFPDIVVSDLSITGMYGVKFLLAVRQLYPSIRVIAMNSESFGSSVPTGIAADAFFSERLRRRSIDRVRGRFDSARPLGQASEHGEPIWISDVRENPSSPRRRTIEEICR
jgi:CheY-like chemotaxis protein